MPCGSNHHQSPSKIAPTRDADAKVERLGTRVPVPPEHERAEQRAREVARERLRGAENTRKVVRAGVPRGERQRGGEKVRGTQGEMHVGVPVAGPGFLFIYYQ
jgi:hypothetical protein